MKKNSEKTIQARQKLTIIDYLGKDIPKDEALFSYEPENGKCDVSLEFVHHIFGEHYEYGLDYLQLLYQKPTQRLPILCLISNDNNTGKSTFVKWLKAIFTQNCTIVGNNQFQEQFNEKRIDFFGNFILCSNNEDKFIIAGDHDDRFWLRKISLPKNDNTNLLNELINEIPYFLYYLNNRKLSTKHEGRMWFQNKL